MKRILLCLSLCIVFLNGDVQLSKSIYDTLMEVQDLTGEKKYKEALSLVESKLEEDLKKGDKAYLLQSKGFILTSENKYKQAIDAFEQMNQLNVMSEETHLRTLYNMAQLSFSMKEYKKSIHYLKEYLQKNKKQNADAYILLAQNKLLLENTKQAIPHIKQAIDIKEQTKSTIPMNWYDLLFSSYYKIKDYDNALECLDIMVRLKPKKKEYWEYLYQLHTLKGDVKEALNTFEQAYILELLNGKDILKFVRFLAADKLYFKSAKLLEKHIQTKEISANEKNLKLLYTLYFSAKEYELSLKVLDTLVKESKKSQYYLEKARIHNMIQEPSKAEKAYKIALKDKKLKGYPKVVMELAYLYYEIDEYEKCKEYLHVAKKFKQTKQKAMEFLEHI